jgi:predicted permease
VIRTLFRRIVALFTRDRLDRDLNDEVSAHLEALTTEYERRGMTPSAARLAARRAFGGVEPMKEIYRDRRGIPWIETLAQDVRYALRMLRRHGGFTAVAVLSLALGIGATTAVFSVVNAAMLRPLAATKVGELVVLVPERRGDRFVLFNPEFEALRTRQHSLSGMFAISEQPFLRVEFPPGSASYVRASLVSGTYFDVLGIAPAAGRLLTEADDDGASDAATSCAAVISDALWNRWFEGRRSAIGSFLRLRDRDCAIVGVAPASFKGHSAGSVPDLWLPLRPLTERRLLESQTLAFYAGVMGRLNPGVTRAEAQLELTALYRHIQSLEPPLPATMRQPPNPSDLTLGVRDGAQGLDGLRRQFGEPLSMVLAAVSLVLLIAAINVANLLLARGAARWPELATRVALGAGRWRLTRQLVTEGGVIAVVGGLLGVVLATVVTPALASAMSLRVGPAALDVSPDRRVLLAACVATMLTALIVGLLPAIRLSGARSPRCLVIGDRSRDVAGSQRIMRTLLLVQFALSLLLVTAAGLLLRTSVGLSAINLGFDQAHVVLLDIADETPGNDSFSAVESDETKMRRAATYRGLDGRLNSIPGVQSASMAWYGLFSANDLWTPLIDPLRPDDRREARVNFVSARYFSTVGMRVMRGRAFTDADGYKTARVVVVNEALVRQRFGGRDPIGAQVTPDYPGEEDRPVTIIGVVADARYNSLRETQTGPMFWAPLAQAPYRINSVSLRVSPGSEGEVTQRAVAAMGSTSPYLMLRRTTTLADQVGDTAARERLLLNLSVTFGVFALVLAAIGLHGTLAYKVARRRREIGVRLALGAQRSSVVKMFVHEALALAGASALLGIPLALAAGSSLRVFLFGVEPQDPVTVLAACTVLMLTVLVASGVPAIRASRVDPVIALRSE